MRWTSSIWRMVKKVKKMRRELSPTWLAGSRHASFRANDGSRTSVAPHSLHSRPACVIIFSRSKRHGENTDVCCVT
jgi:hypothetical protein